MAHLRFEALRKLHERTVVTVSSPSPKVSDFFGENVFGSEQMRGSLAPDGAILKRSAASPGLLSHTGPALVFEDYEEMLRRVDDPGLPVTADSVLVLRGVGPVGVPGMPEWGMIPMPRRLLDQGITDCVRISDGRMSGTSYGTCILHVAPESAVGGPLALVRDGDLIRLDANQRRANFIDGRYEIFQSDV